MKFHVRQKRLIDLTPGGDIRAIYSEVPYIVNIKLNNSLECLGVILSQLYLLCPNSCIDVNKLSKYRILSGSANLYEGYPHNIVQKLNRIRGHEHLNDLALLAVHPRLGVVSTMTRPIALLQGPVPVNTHGLISGWGRNVRPS